MSRSPHIWALRCGRSQHGTRNRSGYPAPRCSKRWIPPWNAPQRGPEHGSPEISPTRAPGWSRPARRGGFSARRENETVTAGEDRTAPTTSAIMTETTGDTAEGGFMGWLQVAHAASGTAGWLRRGTDHPLVPHARGTDPVRAGSPASTPRNRGYPSWRRAPWPCEMSPSCGTSRARSAFPRNG